MKEMLSEGDEDRPQKKNIPADKTTTTGGEIIRNMSPSVASYTKDGKELLVGRATLDQFRARENFLRISARIKEMIASEELNENEQELVEDLMSETHDLIETKNTATFRSRKGVTVDYYYQTAQRLEKAWEKISQLEKIAGAKPAS